MKFLLIALLLTCGNLFAGEQSWEIVKATTEQLAEPKIKLTVTVKNISKVAQSVPASQYEGQVGMAIPNSYLWPQDQSMKEAMRPSLSHYYTHNSRSCHAGKQLTIPSKGEVSFIMYDVNSTVGQRLLLLFGDRLIESDENIIGALTVPNPKKSAVAP